MLAWLHYRNWGSLWNVEINNLAPLTLSIGASSSGKTNLLDGWHFLAQTLEWNPETTLSSRGGNENIHTYGLRQDEPVLLEFSFRPDHSNKCWQM